MVWSGVMPDHSRKLASQRATLGGREQAHELDPGDVGTARRERGPAPLRTPPARPVRVRSTRFIDTCDRPRDASRETQRAHTGQPAVALAHTARDRACERARRRGRGRS